MTLRLTHRNIQFSCPSFELAVNYEGIYATHLDSQDEASLIVKGVSRDQRSQVLQIRSPVSPFILNNIQYRSNLLQIWSRRLKYGVIREALRYPLMLSQLNANRTIFG